VRKKAVCFISFVMILSIILSNTGRADLVGWWKLDDGSGTRAADSSGNANHGTLQGDPQWVTGRIAGALQFDGVDDFVDVPHNENLTADNEVTVMAWINTPRHEGPNGEGWQGILSKSNNPRSYSFYTNSSGYLHFSTAGIGSNSSTTVPLNEWVHVCAIVVGGEHQFYINGEPAGTSGSGVVLPGTADTANVVIGRTQEGANRSFLGMIDDVRIYMRGLTQDEVQLAMTGEGLPAASSPNPPDGTIHEDTWITLSWRPGDYADSHDVYMGDNFDDVNDGVNDTFQGNQSSTFFVAGFPGFAYPEGLVPGTTYYWRVDEVSDTNPDSPWKGPVWSFFIPPRKAYNPDPADGVRFVDSEVTLTWSKGLGAKLHTVYFGDNFDDVNTAVAGIPAPAASYDPGPLEPDKTYYWRVDEFDGAAAHKGNVWSFTTLPYITMTDPNLVGWWKFEEGSGDTVLDSSGHGNHGKLRNGPQWVAGFDGDALEFDGVNDWVEVPHDDTLTVDNEVSVMAWINTTRHTGPPGQDYQGIIAKGNSTRSYSLYTQAAGTLHFSTTSEGAYVGSSSAEQVPLDEWVHVAAMVVDGRHEYYINGEPAGEGGGGITLPGATDTDSVVIGRTQEGATRSFLGMIDDPRIYNRALTQDEIKDVMRGDLTLAYNPSPDHRSTPDINAAIPLTWSPGEQADQHDVYFGMGKNTVENADASDTSGTYRGRQSETRYTPPEGVDWGGGPYYWRIDEVNTDGTISKGNIWNFTVADYLLVDDFEGYTDNDADGEAIWQAWIDGFGIADNGSQVGYLLPPYAESRSTSGIVHGGLQSMPLLYNNTAGVTNSEAVLTLTSTRDWTEQEVAELSLWFRGNPTSVGSFIEAPAGTYSLTAAGVDIWNTVDEFHYAYKVLTGVGSMEAQVLRVQNTNDWAKAGVMIRETLEPGSKFAAVYITPANGCRFQARTTADAAATSDTDVATSAQTAITAPYRVKIERDTAGNFRGYYSSNGTTWQAMTWNPQYIPMSSNVYIGLALTSHEAGVVCEAKFSNVRTTGTVTGQWTSQDIGIASNAAEPLYVAVSNPDGIGSSPAVVAHDDPAAATIDDWVQWRVPLQAFADQGINLSNVDKIAIGLGNKSGLVTPGGSGTMYFDDIRLYRPSDTADE